MGGFPTQRAGNTPVPGCYISLDPTTTDDTYQSIVHLISKDPNLRGLRLLPSLDIQQYLIHINEETREQYQNAALVGTNMQQMNKSWIIG